MGAVVTKNVSDLCSSLFRRENSMSHHKKPVLTENEDPEEDPVISKLQKTGCLEKHYAVLECMSEHKDWRKCQEQVHDFRSCMVTYENKKSTKKD